MLKIASGMAGSIETKQPKNKTINIEIAFRKNVQTRFKHERVNINQKTSNGQQIDSNKTLYRGHRHPTSASPRLRRKLESDSPQFPPD